MLTTEKLCTIVIVQRYEMKNLFKTFAIDSSLSIPVYKQVKQHIVFLIISGALKEGDKLLPIREFASILKINPNTIVKIYYQLDVEGYVESRPGSGYFVKECSHMDREKETITENITREFLIKVSNLGKSPEEIIKTIKKISKNQKNNTK